MITILKKWFKMNASTPIKKEENENRFFRLQTTLKNYKFDTIHRQGPTEVIWYKLNDNGDKGICMTQRELDELKQYMNSKPNNLENLNDLNCDPDETPYYGILGSLPLNSNYPKYLMLKSNPQLTTIGIHSWMDIELTDKNGNSNHNYTVSFDIIGEIIY